MATPLTINGVVFNYPQNFDTNWGIDATGWAQAVTSGMLQKAGGSFPLTADVDFGASFGLKAAYFETRVANAASSGTIRLASADAGVVFRNNVNSGNLVLTTDASDNLLYNGHILNSAGASPVLSITGTANQIIASSPTGNVTLSLPQNIAITSTPTFNGIALSGPSLIQNATSVGFQDGGSVHTIAVKSPTTAANYSLILPPNAGSNGQFLQTDGFGTTTWVNATGSGTVNSGTQYQLAYYAATGATVSGDSSITTNASNQLLVSAVPGTPTYSFTGHPGTGIAYNSSFIPETLDVITNSSIVAKFATIRIDIEVPLNLNSNPITNVPDPTNPQDAATKNYVDQRFGNGKMGTLSGQATTGNAVFTNTGLAVTITPKSSTSKILIVASGSGSHQQAASHVEFSLARGASNLGGSSGMAIINVGANGGASASTNWFMPVSLSYLDSPGTTSAVTYNLTFRGVSGPANVYFGYSGSVSTITAYEIFN